MAKFKIPNLKIKHFYYYVPPCPKCGSRITGRYVKQPRKQDDAEYMQRESLKHGELIRFVPSEPTKNCYCEECEYEWGHKVQMYLISKERMNEEIEVRDTLSLYREFNEKYPRKKKSFFGRIFGFLP